MALTPKPKDRLDLEKMLHAGVCDCGFEIKRPHSHSTNVAVLVKHGVPKGDEMSKLGPGSNRVSKDVAALWFTRKRPNWAAKLGHLQPFGRVVAWYRGQGF